MRKQGREGKIADAFAHGGRIPGFCQLEKMCRLIAIRRVGRQSTIKAKKDGELALKAVRRRARKERRMPGTADAMNLKNRRSSLDLLQDNDCSRNRDRRRRMHSDAQRAVVAVGVHLVYVGHLHDRQQGQQDQTYEGGNGQCPKTAAATFTPQCLASCQLNLPDFKNTHIWILDVFKADLLPGRPANSSWRVANTCRLRPSNPR